MGTFLHGITSFLTPNIFLYFLVIPILFEKFGNSKKQHFRNLFFFVAFFLTLYFLFIFNWLKLGHVYILSTYFIDTLILNYAKLLFFGWYLYSFHKKQSKNQLVYLAALGLFLFANQFALNALVNVSPIIGMQLIEKIDFNTTTIWQIISFAIGLITPLILIYYIVIRFYEKLKRKKGWKWIQISLASILLYKTILKIIITTINFTAN